MGGDAIVPVKARVFNPWLIMVIKAPTKESKQLVMLMHSHPNGVI